MPRKEGQALCAAGAKALKHDSWDASAVGAPPHGRPPANGTRWGAYPLSEQYSREPHATRGIGLYGPVAASAVWAEAAATRKQALCATQCGRHRHTGTRVVL